MGPTFTETRPLLPASGASESATTVLALTALVALAALGTARADSGRPPATARAASERASAGPDDVGPDCREARRDWAEAAVAARAPLDGLEECLAAGTPPCAADLAAVRSLVAELTAHAQRIDWTCSGGKR
jgi:hypothetical protein